MPGSTDANFSDNFSDLSYVKPKKKCPSWLYNSRTGEFLGRTSRSWCLIFIFYVIYYALLAGFFMGMLCVFLYFIIPQDVPLRTGDNSLLRLTPGIGMRPVADIKDSLIKYSPADRQTSEPFVQSLDLFFNDYKTINSKNSENFATCTNGKKTPDDVEKVCKFDLETLGDCGKGKYGYDSDKPCVVVKLNKIYGWLPDIKDKSVPHPLVKCKGQNPLDQENMGTIKYFPEVTMNGQTYGKMDSAFFPFLGQKSYLSPVVAVQFQSLKKNVVVLVECELENVSKNVWTDPVKFELLLDSN